MPKTVQQKETYNFYEHEISETSSFNDELIKALLNDDLVIFLPGPEYRSGNLQACPASETC